MVASLKILGSMHVGSLICWLAACEAAAAPFMQASTKSRVIIVHVCGSCKLWVWAECWCAAFWILVKAVPHVPLLLLEYNCGGSRPGAAAAAAAPDVWRFLVCSGQFPLRRVVLGVLLLDAALSS
jgi:hypothetical protein